MSDQNFEHFDGDWEEYRGDLCWSESQWRNYLNGSERDTARFLSIYNTVKDRPNHLDEAAVLMGWDAEDISLTEDFLSESEAESDAEDGEPYTMHRHPVYVVTRALYRYLQQSWERVLHNEQASGMSPLLCWKYGRSLHQGEMNAILAIQALDLGDFGLVVCHLKNALASVNQGIGILDEILPAEDSAVEVFKGEMRIRLFDLRELWLRVMGDCRSEYQRRSKDQN